MTQTKKSNLVSAPVFADAVKEAMGDKIVVSDIAFKQDFSNQQVGTITVPKYSYIGDAELKAEGVAIDPTLLSGTSENLAIQTFAKAVELTDEAMKGGIGNPVEEAKNQLAIAAANAVDNVAFEAMADATLTKTVADLGAVGYFSAQALFGENQDEAKVLFVNPADAVAIQASDKFENGRYFGAVVRITNKVDAGTAYLVQEGGVGIYLAQDVEVESDRDILAKTEVIASSVMFAAHVRDESKVVKITIGTAGEEDPIVEG